MLQEKDFEVWSLIARERDSGYFREAVKAQGQKGRVLTVETGYGPLLRDYVYFLLAKLAFHRQHPEFNGLPSLHIVHMTAAKKPLRTF